MSIQIGNYSFDGPYRDAASLRNNSGVYAVLTRAMLAGPYTVVDIGEAGWVRDRLLNHDRQRQWAAACGAAGLSFAALYCDETARMRVERELRVQFRPVCGVR